MNKRVIGDGCFAHLTEQAAADLRDTHLERAEKVERDLDAHVLALKAARIALGMAHQARDKYERERDAYCKLNEANTKLQQEGMYRIAELECELQIYKDQSDAVYQQTKKNERELDMAYSVIRADQLIIGALRETLTQCKTFDDHICPETIEEILNGSNETKESG